MQYFTPIFGKCQFFLYFRRFCSRLKIKEAFSLQSYQNLTYLRKIHFLADQGFVAVLKTFFLEVELHRNSAVVPGADYGFEGFKTQIQNSTFFETSFLKSSKTYITYVKNNADHEKMLNSLKFIFLILFYEKNNDMI